MNFADAALTAMYPLIVFLCVLAMMRYASIIRSLDNGIRHLVCATLVLQGGVFFEQILYGYGRLSGHYVTIATNPGLVSIGKILLASGLVYMLFAFWLIQPSKIKWWNYPAVALVCWIVLTVGLMF